MNEQGKSLTAQGKKALVKVAEWLEAGAPHVVIKDGIEIGQFNMEYGVETGHEDDDGNSCGTACCIAGAVCQFEMLGSRDHRGGLDFFTGNADHELGAGGLARDFLGIDDEDAGALFMPWDDFDYDVSSDFSNPKLAAAVVRHYLATGEVDWNRFDEYGVDTTLEASA